MELEHILFLLLAVYGVLSLRGLVLHHRLLRRLQHDHPQVWQELGRPTLFLNNSVSNGFAVLRFVQQREYMELKDPELRSLADRVRWYNQVGWAFFAVVAVLILFGEAVFRAVQV